MIKKFVYHLAVLSLALSMRTAFASQMDYTLTNVTTGDSVTFAIPLPLTILPCDFYGDTSCFAVGIGSYTIDGSVNIDPTAQVLFFDGTPGPDGGLVLWDAPTFSTIVNQGGPLLPSGMYETLYSGTLADPTLEDFTNLPLQTYGYGGPAINESFVLNVTGGPAVTPEPGSILLLGSGLLGLVGAARRRFGR